MSDQSGPADPNQGFPNPHAEDYKGTRTPAEQYEYEQQQKARDAANATPAETPPANPTGAEQSAY